jgi:hypothetical protein
MAWTVEVSGDCQTEADQGKECGDRMHDKDGGETVASRRGEGEVGVAVWAGEEAIFAGL